MNISLASLATALLIGAAAIPAVAQSDVTIKGTESAPGNASGGPSAATTTGNIATTTTTADGSVYRTNGGGPLAPGSVDASSNSVIQTPGSPANTGK